MGAQTMVDDILILIQSTYIWQLHLNLPTYNLLELHAYLSGRMMDHGLAFEGASELCSASLSHICIPAAVTQLSPSE